MLPETNVGSKIGYLEQTWDPKLVTQMVSGKVCLEHVLNVSETCLDCALIVGRTGMYPLHVGKFGFGEKMFT